MATHAVYGIQSVIVVCVALRAGGCSVCANQRKAGNAVVEACLVGPGDRVVAIGAVRDGERWPRTGVHRIVGLLPGAQVAAGVTAIRRSNLQIVIVVDVALRACRHLTGRSQLVRIR